MSSHELDDLLAMIAPSAGLKTTLLAQLPGEQTRQADQDVEACTFLIEDNPHCIPQTTIAELRQIMLAVHKAKDALVLKTGLKRAHAARHYRKLARDAYVATRKAAEDGRMAKSSLYFSEDERRGPSHGFVDLEEHVWEADDH